MLTFKQLGLSEEILKSLRELGFEKPTEIQEQAIPVLIEEETDMIGLAQTGTGKTAAFGLPLLDKIDPSHQATQGLILAPTRELGKQIAEQLEIFSKFQKDISVLPVYGGAAIINQIKALRRTQHIIIATPGRLIDLIKRKAVKLGELKYLILDEADEMLNMGFKEDLDTILSYTPEDKRTWLFSATMPSFIKKIVQKYMEDPVEIRINPSNEVNKNIEHLFAAIRPRDKFEALTRFIDINPEIRGVVFCRTKRETQDIAERLLKRNYRADALHGDLSQAQRDRVMKRFKKNDLKVLIATDVAARGIDVNDLTHVFHFSLPDDNSYYTHRSGRTARAGKKGKSIAFIAGNEGYRIRRIEKQLSISFKKAEVPEVEQIAKVRINNWCTGILEKKTKGKVPKPLFDMAVTLFDGISKDELIAKILSDELDKINLGANKDLNEEESSGGGGDRDRRGRGGSGRRGGSGGRGGFKKRKWGGGDKKDRSGGSGGYGKKRSASSSYKGKKATKKKRF